MSIDVAIAMHNISCHVPFFWIEVTVKALYFAVFAMNVSSLENLISQILTCYSALPKCSLVFNFTETIRLRNSQNLRLLQYLFYKHIAYKVRQCEVQTIYGKKK